MAWTFLVDAFASWFDRWAVNNLSRLMVLLWFVPVLGIMMALSLPLVGWARIRLKHHTLLQIFLGWAVTITSVLITFNLML